MRSLPYTGEYRRGRPFWDFAPGSLLPSLAESLRGAAVLDLGCGEGKNAIFAARFADKVVAVDPSDNALSNFTLNPGFAEVHNRINRIQADAWSCHFPAAAFDVVIAYGLLHCASHWQDAVSLVPKMRSWTRPGGVHVVVALEAGLPVDAAAHPYLTDDALIPSDELAAAYGSDRIRTWTVSRLTESHPTNQIVHTHSVLRAVIEVADE